MSAKDKLLAAASAALAQDGIAGVSARSIAARAEVNQALVFYHFNTVTELLEAAVRWSVDAAVAEQRVRLAAVTSVAELVGLASTLQGAEAERGNVAQMAQVMAGAQRDETLARAARYAIGQWRDEVEVVLRRVLAGSVLGDLVDPAGLAGAVTAGFIGLQLYEGVDAEGAAAAMGSLAVLGTLAEVVDGLGPVAGRVVRSQLRQLAVTQPTARR